MSTFITFTTDEAETKVHVYPPLTDVKEVELQDFKVNYKVVSKNTFYLCCDIIDSRYSYTNFKREDPNVVKVCPSNLLAIVPSETYPSVPIRNSSLPINSFTISIFDENGTKADCSNTISISLKVKLG